MNASSRWLVVAVALTAAACSSGGGGGGGSAAGGASIDCSWFTTTTSCYRTVANAAKACTNAALTGTFNGDTSLCTYSDGTTVHFDGAYTATVANQNFGPWDFSVVTSTASTCARYTDLSDSSWTLTAGGGTFRADWTNDPLVFTCPDGTTYSMAGDTALSCVDDFPGWFTLESGGNLGFYMTTAPSSAMLWRCR
jgi:hypothetical protein